MSRTDPPPSVEPGAAPSPSSIPPSLGGAGSDALGVGSRMVPPGADFGVDDATPALSPEREREREALEEQIRELEARLGALGVASAPAAGAPDAAPGPGGAPDLQATEFYQKRWGRMALRSQAEVVDDFGFDPAYEARAQPVIDFLFERYFRTTVEGAERVPAEGRCLLVANHSGTLPLDGLMLRAALRRHHPAAPEARWLAEDFVFYLPFLGTTMNRLGAVRACQENAQRLLGQERLVAVFPEGAKGTGKLYRERYRLQRFGRGGFVRLALRTRSPLVPVAIVGAEDTHPLLGRLELPSRLAGLPYLPITPLFPWLGPLGLLPAPARWRILFGEPLDFSEHGPEAADDHVLVARLSDQVRSVVQSLLDRARSERGRAYLR